MRKLILVLMSIFVSATYGGELYWNGANSGSSGGSNDYWDAASENWNSAADGSGSQQVWGTGSDATFGYDPGTVDLLIDPSAGVVTANSDYTLHGDDGAGTNTLRQITASEFNVAADKTLTMDWAAPYGEGGAVVRKTGDGTLNLKANMSGGNINMTVDAGRVVASTKQGTGWWGDGLLNGSWTVNSGATAELQGAHIMDYGGQTVNVNGGTLTSDSGQYMGTINISDGGTLEQSGSSNWRLRKNVTVTGSDTSATFAGASGQLQLFNDITFDVGDGSIATDLLVENEITGGNKLAKTGTGTMVVQGDMNYTGGTEVQTGTLVASNSLEGTGMVTLSGGDLKLQSAEVAAATNFFTAGSLSNGGGGLTLTLVTTRHLPVPKRLPTMYSTMELAATPPGSTQAISMFPRRRAALGHSRRTTMMPAWW